MDVQNLERLLRKIRQEVQKKLASPDSVNGESVVVGYTASYAVYVHENLEAAHGAEYNAKYAAEISAGLTKSGRRKRGWKGKTSRGPNQQAKFLEQPYREMINSGELSKDVATAVKRGEKLQDALLVAALHIQRNSQKIVPVDTGNLKQSAFCEKE